MRADLCDRPENDFFRNTNGALAVFFTRWPKLRLRSLG